MSSFNYVVTSITEIINSIIASIISVLVIGILFELLSLFPSKKKMVDCETMTDPEPKTEPEPNNSQIKLVNLDNLIPHNLIPHNTRTRTPPTILRSYDRYAEYREPRYSNRYYQYDVTSDREITRSRSRNGSRNGSRSPSPSRSRSRSRSPNRLYTHYRSRL